MTFSSYFILHSVQCVFDIFPGPCIKSKYLASSDAPIIIRRNRSTTFLNQFKTYYLYLNCLRSNLESENGNKRPQLDLYFSCSKLRRYWTNYSRHDQESGPFLSLFHVCRQQRLNVDGKYVAEAQLCLLISLIKASRKLFDALSKVKKWKSEQPSPTLCNTIQITVLDLTSAPCLVRSMWPCSIQLCNSFHIYISWALIRLFGPWEFRITARFASFCSTGRIADYCGKKLLMFLWGGASWGLLSRNQCEGGMW